MPDWFVDHPSDQSFTVLQTNLVLGPDLAHTVQALGAADFYLRRIRPRYVKLEIKTWNLFWKERFQTERRALTDLYHFLSIYPSQTMVVFLNILAFCLLLPER